MTSCMFVDIFRVYLYHPLVLLVLPEGSKLSGANKDTREVNGTRSLFKVLLHNPIPRERLSFLYWTVCNTCGVNELVEKVVLRRQLLAVTEFCLVTQYTPQGVGCYRVKAPCLHSFKSSQDLCRFDLLQTLYCKNSCNSWLRRIVGTSGKWTFFEVFHLRVHMRGVFL